MNPQTHRRLADVREKTGREYGKLVQKLLAIALLDAEVERLTERGIQGIDLEVDIAGRRHAIEVKTSETDGIKLGAKDLEGLDRQLDEGARVYVAVLGGRLLDEWLFARYHRGELRPATLYRAFDLRPYRDRALEERVRRPFEEAVARHASRAVTDRQRGLDAVLAGFPNRALA